MELIFMPAPFEESVYKIMGDFYLEGNVICKNDQVKIDFLFKPVTADNAPYIAKETAAFLNGWYDQFHKQGLIVDKSMTAAIDRMLFNLGYKGKVLGLSAWYAYELITGYELYRRF